MPRQWYEVVSPGDAVIAFAMTGDIREEVGWLHAANGNYAQAVAPDGFLRASSNTPPSYTIGGMTMSPTFS
jgi:hypothetical protein